jgi:hypothetical protein
MTVNLLTERRPVTERLGRLLLLSVFPVISAATILSVNYSHYGHPFATGYHAILGSEMRVLILPVYIPENLKILGAWLLRTPWLAPSLAMTFWLCRRERKLLLPVTLAVVAQVWFWLCFQFLLIFSNKYLLPMVGLCALGLPLLGQWLERRFPARGLVYTLIVFLMIGFAAFMRDDGIRPFHTSVLTGELHCSTWYMQPATRPTEIGTPCGWVQGLALVVLLAGGSILLARAWRLAGLHQEEQGG